MANINGTPEWKDYIRGVVNKVTTGYSGLNAILQDIANRLQFLKNNKSDEINSTSQDKFANLAGVKKAYDRGTQAYNLANGKEPKIIKRTGFNLNKSDAINLDSSNVIATSKAVKTAYDRGTQAYNLANQKLGKDYCPYFVGDIYITSSTANPSVHWPHTRWQKLEGRFLLGSSKSQPLGTTGGSPTHKLTIPEMPAHTHNLQTAFGGAGGPRAGKSETSYIKRIKTDSTGGSQPFSIMPPFLSVNMWKRIS